MQAQVGSVASQSHDNLVNRSVAMPRGIGAYIEVGMECHDAQTGEECTWDVGALAEESA